MIENVVENGFITFPPVDFLAVCFVRAMMQLHKNSEIRRLD